MGRKEFLWKGEKVGRGGQIKLTIGNKQHRARWPMVAQISSKLSLSVGVSGAVLFRSVSDDPFLDVFRTTPFGVLEDLRGAQSRSATPSTSVAQHTALLVAPEQSGSWRSKRELLPGTAAAMAVLAPAMATMMLEKCMLTWFWKGQGSSLKDVFG